MLTSFSIALTSLPMPKDVIYEFEGPTYGTTGTCEAQGFVITAGIGQLIGTNTYLTIYYLCKIKFQMEDKVFRKRSEPIFLICNAFLSFSLPITGLIRETLNPSPYEPYCIFSKYPFSCEAKKCIRGGEMPKSAFEFAKWFLIFGVSIQGKNTMYDIVLL